MALATVESLASETRPDLSCLSCVIVCLSIPISSACSFIVERSLSTISGGALYFSISCLLSWLISWCIVYEFWETSVLLDLSIFPSPLISHSADKSGYRVKTLTIISPPGCDAIFFPLKLLDCIPVASKKSTFFISFSFKKARILSFMVKISPIFVFRLKFYPYICSVFKV